MNKREASGVKRLFTPANCAIIRICDCYISAGRNKKTGLKGALLSLPEEKAFKYFIVFRNALSGTVEKDLINMGSPLHTEIEGGTRHFLMKLWDSQFKDDGILEELYDRVITNYDYGESYYTILIHCAYDIPARAMDGMEMFDAPEYVYEFIQCTTRPVKLAKAGLSCDPLTNVIESRNGDWLVEAPDQGFLFPAFNDRNTDIHSLLYYSKNPEQIPEILINKFLGYVAPISAKSQKETFQAIAEETLGGNCDFETVKTIHESLAELVEEIKGEPVPLTLDKCQVKKPLETNGATPERLEEFEQRYAQVKNGPGTSFAAASVVNAKSFKIRTPDMSIRVAPDKTYLVENRIIEGQPCITIAINEHVKTNGIPVRPIGIKKPEEE